MAFVFRNLIFSHHAEQRLKDRSISPSQAWDTINQPDHKFKKPTGSGMVFERIIDGRRFQIVASKLSEQNKWLVVSCWVRGEKDKESLIWTLLALPFRIVWWLIKLVIGLFKK